MERVALDLQNTAHARRENREDFDLFGRSAFNRYYYSTFLIARSMMMKFNPGWRGSHSTLPEELTGSVAAEVRRIMKSAQRLGDRQSEAICKAAISALHDLAALLTDGYSVRVIADYNPEIPITPDANDRFRLDRTDINSAHRWVGKARTYVTAIERARALTDGNP